MRRFARQNQGNAISIETLWMLTALAVSALALLFGADPAFASTDATFQGPLDTVTGIVGGTGGQLAAALAVGAALFGSVMRFNTQQLLGAVGVGVAAGAGVGIVTGLVAGLGGWLLLRRIKRGGGPDEPRLRPGRHRRLGGVGGGAHGSAGFVERILSMARRHGSGVPDRRGARRARPVSLADPLRRRSGDSILAKDVAALSNFAELEHIYVPIFAVLHYRYEHAVIINRMHVVVVEQRGYLSKIARCLDIQELYKISLLIL